MPKHNYNNVRSIIFGLEDFVKDFGKLSKVYEPPYLGCFVPFKSMWYRPSPHCKETYPQRIGGLSQGLANKKVHREVRLH